MTADQAISKTCAIGIDLGGQSIKAGVVDAAGTLLCRCNQPVDKTLSPSQAVSAMADMVKTLRADDAVSDHDLCGIGIVMPGYMNRDRSQLLFAANLPQLSGSSLLADLKNSLDLPVVFDADCNAAAVAEHAFGAGADVHRLVVATVGTGIGAGVIIDGQIPRTMYHIAGSLGHVIVNPQGPQCPCGGRGCLEAMSAASAFDREARRVQMGQSDTPLAAILHSGQPVTGEDLRSALDQADPVASQVVAHCGWWLGVGVASWCAIFHPDRVLIGGGLAGLGQPLLDAVRKGCLEVGQPRLTQQLEIGLAHFGMDAGLVGAAAEAMGFPRLQREPLP
jgi:glucokinase